MAELAKSWKRKVDKNRNDKPDVIKPIFDPDSVEANYTYTDTLKDFILDKPVTNIALEGNFATGKSSVLYRLLKDESIQKRRPKVISSLTLEGKNKSNEENGGEKEEANPVGEPASISANNSNIIISGADAESNKDFVITLQSEIVRQLFYGEKADKITMSPYRRIGRRYIVIPLTLTTIVSFGWIARLLKLANDDNVLKYAFWNNSWILWIAGVLSVLVFGSCVFVVMQKIISLISKSGIKHVSLKDIDLDLNDNNPDFKQLIDFLMEYFRTTKRKIIIFEDLDRYEDPRIFEELKNLNQAINHSDYFKEEKDKIKFVYLTSGKIFKKPSDKNKIFDATIPMVPFMSASNAEYLFEQELKNRKMAYPSAIEVIGSVSDLITDMRVLKSIANRFSLYSKLFDLNNRIDCNDCASLSVIAELCPIEYDELTRNESTLDSIRIAGESQKNEDIIKIQSDYLPRNLIAKNIELIRNKIMSRVNEPKTKMLRVVVGDKRDSEIGTDLLLALLSRTTLDMAIVFQNAYGSERQEVIENAEIRQIIREVVPLAIDRGKAQEKIQSETIEKRDESVLLLGLKREKKDVPEVIKRLIEGDLISEAYVNYISKSDYIPKRDFVTDFITNAIRRRDKKYVYSYPLKDYSEDILSKMRDSDFLSVGIMNYDLFEELYRTDKVLLKMEKILRLASVHRREFIDFYTSYLERAIRLLPINDKKNYAVGLFIELLQNDFNLSIEIVEAIHSKDEQFAGSLMGLVLANGELGAEEIRTCAAIPNYVDYIRTGMDVVATDNAVKCHLLNGARIEKLVYYNQDSVQLRENIDKISIFLNISNIREMRTELLNGYLSNHAISYGEVDDILNYGPVNSLTVEIIIDKLDELDGNRYDDALNNLYNKATSFGIKIAPERACYIAEALDEEEIEYFVVESCEEKQEVIDVLKASQKIEFAKIDEPPRIMKIKNTKIGEKFALKLERLGLVRIIKKKNDEYLESKEIKLKVL